MQHFGFDDFNNHQGYNFYKLRVKRSNWIYFHFFVVWTRYINQGRIILQMVFALEYGIYLDSNLVSRIMADLWINLAPKKRLNSISFHMDNGASDSSRELILQPVAESTISQFKQLDKNIQSNLLETMQDLAAGERLSEIREDKPWVKPFRRFRSLKELGSKLQDWIINTKASYVGAVAIAIDEKMIRKAFDLTKHPKLSSHWVSRCKTYLPSLMVEVAGIIRPGRLAEVVGHFFPYPQKNYDEKGKRKPMKKEGYLLPFLEQLHVYFGHLPMLADANYASQKLISWFQSKKWHFIMRISTKQKKLLENLQQCFDEDPKLVSIDKWVEASNFGGRVRILGFRKRWVDATGKKKQKRYFLITTMDWEARTVWRFYRSRWTLENTFKALPIVDRTPGLDMDLIRGFLAMSFHVLAPVCYQIRANSRTLSRLLNFPMKVVDQCNNHGKKWKKLVWQNIPTRFARHLLEIGYYRSTEFLSTEVEI